MQKTFFDRAKEIKQENEMAYYELANDLLDEKIANFICKGILDFLNGLIIDEADFENNFKTLLSNTNDFYESFLSNNEHFQNLSSKEKSEIIHSFCKQELPEWIYDETDYDENIENEYSINADNAPYDVAKIDIINDKFQVAYLFNKYNREEKELELSPDYQRNFVWTSKQKSRLIESILIKIPLPIFYIDARDEDKWIVIDGLQRLTSIFTYMNNEFKLSNLEYLKELNGKRFDKLERKYQRRIEEFQILCNLVRPNTPAKIAFNIFQRINTLGTKLEVQEIRNAMHRGKSTTLLSKLSKSQEFVNIVTQSKIKGLSKRMEDHAIILRYLSFKVTHYTNYNNNDMNEFLENTMEKLNLMNDIEIKSLENIFLECMKKGKILFQELAFTKPSNNKTRPNPISKTLFESIGYTLDKYSIDVIETYQEPLRNKLNELYHDKEFILKTSVATNNPSNVKYRFQVIEKLFYEIIGY